MNNICKECESNIVIREEGLCQECLDSLNNSLHKLDVWLLDNWTE